MTATHSQTRLGYAPTASTEGALQLYTITGTRLASVTRIEAIPENGGSSRCGRCEGAGAEIKATLKLDKGKWTFHVQTASGAQAAGPFRRRDREAARQEAELRRPWGQRHLKGQRRPDKAVRRSSQSSGDLATNSNQGHVSTLQSYRDKSQQRVKVEAFLSGGGSPVAATKLQAADAEMTFELLLPSGKWTVQIASREHLADHRARHGRRGLTL